MRLPRRDDADAFRTLFLVSPQSYVNAVDDRTGDDPHASGPALTSGLMRLLSAYRVNPGDWGYGNPGAEGYVDGTGWWRQTRSIMLSAGQYPFSAMRLPLSTQRAVKSHPGPSARQPATWGSWLRRAVQPLWRQQGWLGRSVVWGWDEPGDATDRGVVSQQACTIHRSSPGTRYLLTDTLRAPRARRTVKVHWGRSTRTYTLPAEPGDNRQLWDGKGCNDVDTWVVLSRRYYGTYATPLERYAGLDPAHAELRNIQTARRHGASVWSYTYTGVPGSPGYAADEPVTNPTVFMLWNALEGLGGTLYADGMTTYKGLIPYKSSPATARACSCTRRRARTPSRSRRFGSRRSATVSKTPTWPACSSSARAVACSPGSCRRADPVDPQGEAAARLHLRLRPRRPHQVRVPALPAGRGHRGRAGPGAPRPAQSALPLAGPSGRAPPDDRERLAQQRRDGLVGGQERIALAPLAQAERAVCGLQAPQHQERAGRHAATGRDEPQDAERRRVGVRRAAAPAALHAVGQEPVGGALDRGIGSRQPAAASAVSARPVESASSRPRPLSPNP